jgi:hypothetical protein
MGLRACAWCMVDVWSAELSPDILVFANSREPNDRLLLQACRLAGVPRVVLELPNLFPAGPSLQNSPGVRFLLYKLQQVANRLVLRT